MNSLNLLLHVALPLVTVVIAVLNLFIDPKKPSDRNKLWALVSLLLLGCIGQIYLDLKKEHENTQQALTVIRGVQDNQRGIKQVLVALQTAQALKANGYSPDQVASAAQGSTISSQGITFKQALKKSSEASAAVQRIASRIPTSERQQVSITYFPKDVDGTVVKESLTQLGFQLTTTPAKLPDLATNAVWAGKSVPLDDAKLVALVLVRAGVGIKYVGRIEKSANASLIEVGGSVAHNHLPVLTVPQIETLTNYMPPEKIEGGE